MLQFTLVGTCCSAGVTVPRNLKNHTRAFNTEVPTVAIVGGGAAGLLSARELVAMGYAVTVFEATGRVGGVSTTHRGPDGRAYDISTIFMAESDLYSEGLNECMSALVDEAGLSESVQEFLGATTQWEDFPIPMKQPLLPTSMKLLLEAGKGQDVIDEIIDLVEILDEIVRNPTPGIASTQHLAMRGEAFKAWSKRMKVSSAGDLFITLSDALMGGPAESAYAPYVLNQRARVGPAVYANYVVALAQRMREHGQNPDLSRLRDTPRFRTLVNRGVHPSWLTFDDNVGFEDFWSGLADSLELNALYVNAPVQAVDVVEGGVRIRAVAGIPDQQVFDFVMLTVPPFHMHQILKTSSGLPSELIAARDAFAAVPHGDHGSVTVVVRTSLGPIDGTGSLIVEMEPTYVVGKPVVVAKLYADSDVYTMGIYIQQKCSSLNLTDAANQAVRQIESRLSPRMIVDEIIAIECFEDWPYRPALEQVDAGFFDVLEAAQGRSGIFLTGELFAGSGVPTIAQYAAAAVKRQFTSLRSHKSVCRVQSDGSDIAKGPLDYLSDDSFRWAYSLIVWVVVVFTGFGSEIIIGNYMFSTALELASLEYNFPDAQRKHRTLRHFLNAAEFAFPFLVLTAIGLAGQRNYLALVFLVLGLWSLGTPQCYHWMLRSLFARPFTRATQSVSDKIVAWSFAFGILLHHSATAWAVCCFVTGREQLNRGFLTTMLPLVIQHMASNLRHTRFKVTHVVAMLLIEAFWEWEVFYWLQDFASLNIRFIAWTMLVSHWLYLIGSGVQTCVPVAQAFTHVSIRKAKAEPEDSVDGYLQTAARPVIGSSLAAAPAAARALATRATATRT